MGTHKFMEFVESLQTEGVTFERAPMGGGRGAQGLADRRSGYAERTGKDLDALDIELPRLARRFNRGFKNLDALKPATLRQPEAGAKTVYAKEETREIVFKTMLDAEVHHTIQLNRAGPADYRSVVGFFARQLLKEMRLVGGYEVLLVGGYKTFLREHLFPSPASRSGRCRGSAQPFRARGRQDYLRFFQSCDQRTHLP